MNTDHPQIGRDLAVLIARQPAALVAVEELTTIRSGRQSRASLRLTFDDGQILKGRRFRSLERARIAVSLVPLLGHLPLNAVIDSLGDSWLEEWIPGTALGTQDTTDALCHWAGDLLGSIHTLHIDAIDNVPAAPDNERVLKKLTANLALLAEGGALSLECCDSLRELAQAEQPHKPETGLLHTDFTVENIVADRRGQWHVIDNEHLTLGALDYDLVRTFCLWPMTDSQRDVFCEAYGRYRDAAPALSHHVFWSIVALAQSARVRRLHDQPCQRFLRALEALAAGSRERQWPAIPPCAVQIA